MITSRTFLRSLLGGGLLVGLGLAAALLPSASLAEEPADEQPAAPVAMPEAAPVPTSADATEPDVAPPAARAKTPEPAATDAATTPESASVATPEVALARFTSAVEEREPVDTVTFLDSTHESIVFFTDLRGLEGETVTHRWEHDGQVMSEVPFEVRGPRWRVWSSKRLVPDWLGEWKVEVVKSDGEVIANESFTYQAP